MSRRTEVIAGLGGFAAGAVTGALVGGMTSGGVGANGSAVALIDTGTSPGLVAPTYTFASGSTVQVTVFYAPPTPSSNVVPTSVTGYYANTLNGPYTPATSFTWDLSATGFAFTFNYGSITQQSSVYVYYVVTLNNGASVRTNTLFIQVA